MSWRSHKKLQKRREQGCVWGLCVFVIVPFIQVLLQHPKIMWQIKQQFQRFRNIWPAQCQACEPISKQNSNCSAIWLVYGVRILAIGCYMNVDNCCIQLSFSCCRFHRNNSLKEQLKALRVKEAEDMKALEDMVQRVEENLVATTVSQRERETLPLLPLPPPNVKRAFTLDQLCTHS